MSDAVTSVTMGSDSGSDMTEGLGLFLPLPKLTDCSSTGPLWDGSSTGLLWDVRSTGLLWDVSSTGLLWDVSSQVCSGTSAVRSALGRHFPPPPLSDISFVHHCLLFNGAVLS